VHVVYLYWGVSVDMKGATFKKFAPLDRKQLGSKILGLERR
jgi:hypothetical protein